MEGDKMFLLWHTLLIIGFLGVAFILGFLTGKRYGKINSTKIP